MIGYVAYKVNGVPVVYEYPVEDTGMQASGALLLDGVDEVVVLMGCGDLPAKAFLYTDAGNFEDKIEETTDHPLLYDINRYIMLRARN